MNGADSGAGGLIPCWRARAPFGREAGPRNLYDFGLRGTMSPLNLGNGDLELAPTVLPPISDSSLSAY